MKFHSFLYSFFCTALAFSLSAQELAPNIRLIPGGIEIVDRENSGTPAFDVQRLKKRDHRILLDFMDLSNRPEAGALKNEPFMQSGGIAVGKEKERFSYFSKAERTGKNCVRYTVRVKRDTPAELKETFISIRLNSGLLDVPVSVELESDSGILQRSRITYPRAMQGGWIWSSAKRQKVRSVRIPLHHGELVIRGLTAPAMACKYGSNTGNLRLYLDSGRVSETGAELTVSYEPYRSIPLDLRSVMNMGFRDETPDDKRGGWTDQGPENDLRMMKPGKRTFVNVPFEVVDPAANNGRSVLAFGNPERPYLAKQALIPVGGKTVRWFYFLHADAWPRKSKVGTIQINYRDGSKEQFSVVDGRDVANWWEPKSVSNAAVAWQGQNRNAFLGLYISRFPVKNKPVESLLLTSSNRSVWLILAISGVTAEDLPFPPADAEAVEVPLVLDPRDWREYTLTVEKKTPVKGSMLDFSFLLDAPAGKYGFLKSKGENFVFENRPGIPVRFNGANLCNDIATRYTHEEAEMLADRIAAVGFNAVRLHHFDSDLVDASRTDGAVDPDRLNNLHYLVYAMKKRGIYVTLDLYTRRTAGFPEKFKNMFDVKSRMVFSKALRDNLMNFARTMLTPVNPYTGLSLKDDPALITIGLINEDPMMTVHEQYKYPNADPLRHKAIKAAFESWCSAQGIRAPEKPDAGLYTRFLNEHHLAIYREMTDALRAMGVRQMTSDISCTAKAINAIPRKQFDYVDNHYYFSHPRALGNAWSFPSSYSDGSMTTELFGNMTKVIASRIKGKPLMITEFNFCAPNSFRHEGGLAMGSISAFQNLNGIFVFEYAGYSHNTKWNTLKRTGGHLGWFGVSVDPVRLLTQRVIALLYLRGDVNPAPEDGMETLTVTPDDYSLPAVQSFSFYRQAEESDIPAKFHNLAFYTKIATDAAERVPAGSHSLKSMLSGQPLKLSRKGRGVYQPKQGKIVSSTGEITVDGAAGIIRVATPASEGFTMTGKSMKGNRLSVAGNTGACSVFAGALDGRTLADTCRAVIFHLTDIQPTGRKTTVLGKQNIVYNWGKMEPYLMRKSRAEISLRNSGKGKLRINALDVNGAVLSPVPFRETDGVVTFTADTGAYGAMAYEFIRE